MDNLCPALHRLFASQPIRAFPFDSRAIPANGIYILFEEGELAHGGRRIVRVGTHTGQNQLPSRLHQHFLNEKKDRSIFRKNIGRALLNRVGDAFLADWNLDLTTKAARLLHQSRIDASKQASVEQQVSAYIQNKFKFVVFAVSAKKTRLLWESRIVSTISSCTECGPSAAWLGRSSPVPKICNSGMWQVNELNKSPFSEDEFDVFRRAASLEP